MNRPSQLQKTSQLIIYIASKLKDKPTYGSTLLNKALYLIDAMSYLKRGKPVTAFDYIKQGFGHTPNPSSFLSIRDSLVSNKQLQKVESEYFGRKQIKFISNSTADINVFDKGEIVLIDEVLESLCQMSAKEVSDYSHTFISWKFAQDKEKLPMFTFLLSKEDPSTKDYAWATKEIEAYRKNKKSI